MTAAEFNEARNVLARTDDRPAVERNVTPGDMERFKEYSADDVVWHTPVARLRRCSAGTQVSREWETAQPF
jgi:hypothetical protein